MKERPMLMSAPMVRAILAGTKTQTRRVVKPQPTGFLGGPGVTMEDGTPAPRVPVDDCAGEFGRVIQCPYGQPGDRLWVRESGWERPERTPKMMREGADTWPRFAYAADDWSEQDRADFKAWGFKPRPSIHMPRWASRILLEIVDVRVERLQDIGEDDATAEGLSVINEDDANLYYSALARENQWPDGWHFEDPVGAYRELWESINGSGSWAANPWVWCISFRRID